MAALSNGSGFVGFGDYENANQGATDSAASGLEAAQPDWNADLATANSDINGINSSYDADKQQDALAKGQASVQQGIQPGATPAETTTKHVTQTPNAGGGSNVNVATVTNPTVAPAANYSDWENNQPAPTLGQALVGAGSAANKANDPNNPYNVNSDTTYDPTSTAAYGQAQTDFNTANQDTASSANLGSFGGAFSALQGKYGGPGSDFDANLLSGNGGLHQYSDAAAGGQATAGALQGTLNTDLAADAGQVLSNNYTPPATPPAPNHQPGAGTVPLAPNGHNGVQTPAVQPEQTKKPLVNKSYNWGA